MDSVRNNALDPNLYLQEETVPVAEEGGQRLNQEDFFAILTEQLANQDPTKPVDNDQMVAQMTNFTIAEGITDLNEKFDTFATSMTSNQALQASTLIGQDVLVPGNIGFSTAANPGMSGVVINDQTAQDMTITIENEIGEIVKTIDAGTQGAGNIQFDWDGTDASGNVLPPGNYVVKAQASVNGEATSLPTAVNRHVDSVSLASASQGVILNLDGNVSISLNDAIQIGG